MTYIPLCHVNDIAEGATKGFNLPQAKLFAIKKQGQFYIYINRCPHFGVELNWQEDQFLDPDGGYLQCSTHGALFVIQTGECVRGPCQGDSLWQIDVHIEDGQLMIDEADLPPPEPTI